MAVARWLLLIALCQLAAACAAATRANPNALYPAAHEYSGVGVDQGPAAFAGDAPSAALRASFESRVIAKGSSLQPDARLGLVARFLLAEPAAASDTALWTELVARHLGVFDARLDAAIVPAEADPGRAISEVLAAKLRARAYTHYGVALENHNGQRRLSLVLAMRQLDLEPVPRTVPSGSTLQLRGHLPYGVTSARVELMQPGAARALLALGSERGFAIQLPTAEAGLYRIEIVAERDGKPVTLATLPIYVGIAAPRRIVLPSVRHAYDLAALKARVMARINAQRQQNGLPALRRDSALDDVAQRHCQDMREHGFVGHVSATTGDATQRVSQAGLPSALVLETLERGLDARALEAAAADAQGEGRQLLAREVTDVGIGIVEVPDAYGGSLLATEVFAQLTAAPDLASATPRLLSQLNQARAQRGSDPLALDPGLSEVATRAAQRFMSDASLSEKDTIDGAQHELGRFSLAYRRVNALLTLTHDLQDAATLEPALDARAEGLGIGIAQGRRPEHGAVMAVVMIVGLRR